MANSKTKIRHHFRAPELLSRRLRSPIFKVPSFAARRQHGYRFEKDSPRSAGKSSPALCWARGKAQLWQLCCRNCNEKSSRCSYRVCTEGTETDQVGNSHLTQRQYFASIKFKRNSVAAAIRSSASRTSNGLLLSLASAAIRTSISEFSFASCTIRSANCVRLRWYTKNFLRTSASAR